MQYKITSKKKSWWQSPVVAWLLVGAVIWGSAVFVRAYFKQRDAVSLKEQYAQELADLQNYEAELQKKIQSLSTDAGVESEIRERYRVVKPGEQLVVIVDNDETSDASGSQKRGFWQNVRGFVGW